MVMLVKALNAAVDPRLMRARRAMIVAVTPVAIKGRCDELCTYAVV